MLRFSKNVTSLPAMSKKALALLLFCLEFNTAHALTWSEVKANFEKATPATEDTLQLGTGRDCEAYIEAPGYTDALGNLKPADYPIFLDRGMIAFNQVGINAGFYTCGPAPGVNFKKIQWGDAVKLTENQTPCAYDGTDQPEAYFRRTENNDLIIEMVTVGKGSISNPQSAATQGFLICPASKTISGCDLR